MLPFDGAAVNANRGCEACGTASHGGGRSRLLKAAGTALPGVIATLLPKCPLCVAAWVAAATGVALPAIVAGSIRPFLAMACLLPASLVVGRAIVRFLDRTGRATMG